MPASASESRSRLRRGPPGVNTNQVGGLLGAGWQHRGAAGRRLKGGAAPAAAQLAAKHKLAQRLAGARSDALDPPSRAVPWRLCLCRPPAPTACTKPSDLVCRSLRRPCARTPPPRQLPVSSGLPSRPLAQTDTSRRWPRRPCHRSTGACTSRSPATTASTPPSCRSMCLATSARPAAPTTPAASDAPRTRRRPAGVGRGGQ